MANKIYARNDQSRAYVFENGAQRCDPDPLYFPCVGVESVTRDKGDITIVECPDPNRYGEYVQVDGIPGQTGRWTTTLMGRVILGEESPLYRLNDKCAQGFSIHINKGTCETPTDLSQFAEMEVWEDVRITSYTTSPMAALSSDGRESLTESVDISFKTRQRFFNLSYALLSAPAEDDATALAVAMVPSWCCGSKVCQIALFVTSDSAWYTFNGGQSWTNDTDFGAAETAGGFTLANRFFVLQNSIGYRMYRFSANAVLETTDVAISGIGAIGAFAAGANYGLIASVFNIHKISASGQVVSSVSVAAFSDAETKVNRMSIAPDGTAVAVLDKGTVIYSKDGIDWVEATPVTGTTPLVGALVAKSATNWMAGTSTGKVYCTDDQGLTWNLVLDVSAVASSVSYDIVFVNDHVGYMSIKGIFYRTVDGGATWTQEPADPGRPFVALTAVKKIAVCPDNVNFLMLAGESSAPAARIAVGRVS